MTSEFKYKGTRWYKCDLHLHTVASACFQDKQITAEQWVEKAIQQGLDCVAVSDHNTGLSVDEIKKAAQGRELIVFPSVEITCDSSKVHLLIVFDVNKTSADIRDFLVRANIPACDFGKQDACTSNSLFDIAKLAKDDGAVVIPAHIDSYNGLGSISVTNLQRLFKDYDINAVQVVHKEFLNPTFQVANNEYLKNYLNEYYATTTICDAEIKDWFKPVKYALEHNLAILTFSDNPASHGNAKHGIWGIGTHFSWIKMDETPSLEGLRQAFLSPEYRVKNEFDSLTAPYQKPDLWIKSISITGSTITESSSPLKIDFSPQLNALIGGRGSGKSSILRFIRGVFNQTKDIADLTEIFNDHSEFYKRETSKSKKGVLTDVSVIEIEFVRNDVLHKIIASNINDSNSQVVEIKRFKDRVWEDVQDEGYLDFFEFEHYSQKQIYEIAQKPNALRERIDRAIDGLDKLKTEREHIKSLFLEKSAAIRTVEVLLSGKGKIETKIKDLDSNIQRLQRSGITELLTVKDQFSEQRSLLNKFQLEIEERENKINELAKSIGIIDINYSSFNISHKQDLQVLSKSVIDRFDKIKKTLYYLGEEARQIKERLKKSIIDSKWQDDLDKNTFDFNLKKEELQHEGIDSILSYEKFTKEKGELEKELEEIKQKENSCEIDKAERNKLQNDYLVLSKEITKKRQEFVKSVVTDDKVKVSIKPFRNKSDFESKLRKAIQRENNSYQTDLDALIHMCFNGVVENEIGKVRNIFKKIKASEDVNSVVSGHFVNLVKSLTDAQIDEIELMLPEDEIDIQYKPSPKAEFKSLSIASAGQKTTAILTFILSYGKTPLILDQPEDDLDNRLVYELIVDRLKQAKEKRQLIVVTHNANIPVNGDAEYIISMDSESKSLKVLHTGTVEQLSIKKEICDVMEGGEIAFEMRSRRYKCIN